MQTNAAYIEGPFPKAPAPAHAAYSGAGSATGAATCSYKEYATINQHIVVGEKVPRDRAPPTASITLWRGEGRPSTVIRTQTPKMRAPYGLSDNAKFLTGAGGDAAEKLKHYVDLSLQNWETDPEINAWYEFVLTVENAVIEHAKRNKATWFKPPPVRGNTAAKATISDEVVDGRFKSSIRWSQPKAGKDGQMVTYPPTFKAKCRYNRGNVITSFWSDQIDPATGKNRQLTMEDARRSGITVTNMIEVGPVWFTPGEDFGITWLVNQVKIFTDSQGSSSAAVETYAFDDANMAVEFATSAPMQVVADDAAMSIV